MSNMIELAKEVSIYDDVQRLIARRVVEAIKLLHAECELIATRWNGLTIPNIYQLRVSEATNSGFRVSREDKKLTALFSSRPTHLELSYIRGYTFDPSTTVQSVGEITVSTVGAFVFAEGKRLSTATELADRVCDIIIKSKDM